MNTKHQASTQWIEVGPSNKPSGAAVLQQMLMAYRQPTEVGRALAARSQLALQISQQYRLKPQVLGQAPLFEGTRRIRSSSIDWALMNLSEDPLWQTGRYPVPGRILRKLRGYHRAGIEFDALYVAHELPPEISCRNGAIPCEALLPPPPSGALRTARALGTVAQGLWATALAPLKVAGVIAVAANEVTALAMRDPVLLGVLIPPGREPEPGVPGIWFVLGTWVW